MTCKDCIHYDACKNAAHDYAGKYAVSMYDDHRCCKVFAEHCENFSNKSEWFHLPCKDCKTAYYVLGYSNNAQIIEEPIYGLAIKNGKHYIIDECRDFYEIGEEVFLTKEEAQKVVEQRKKE